MRVLTRDEIKEVDDRKVSDPIPVPEWGADACVHCRVLGGVERDAFEEAQARMSKGDEYGFMRNLRARMVALFACDAEGKRIFNDADAEWLGTKSAAALDRVFDVGRGLNGWSKKDIEELEGNSDGAPSDGTGTA